MAPKKVPKTSYDFEVAIRGIIPASEKERSDGTVTARVREYQKYLRELAHREIARTGLKAPFPKGNRVVATVVQFMASEEACWSGHDVDNFAKTILDPLEGIVYESDSQVQVLLSAKHVVPNQPNIAYIGVKRIPSGTTYHDLLTCANIEHALDLCSDLANAPEDVSEYVEEE